MQSTAADENVPVLIVGGGGAGLTASMLLAREGVEHLLVSARATTSDLPNAHVLNQRAMEVLDDVGAAEVIAQRSTPAEQLAATAYFAGFAGPPDSEEWVIHLKYPFDCAETDAAVEADLRKALGIGDLPIEIHKITRWSVEAMIASAPALLDTYEAERRIRVYQPSTRPGSPLLHAWVDDEDGNRRPIKNLVAPGRFLLIAGEDGEAWCEAAQALATEANLPLDALRIGHLDGDVYDSRCAWLGQREIQSDGAILVRPDRFIAWRCPTAADDPQGALGSALSEIPACPTDAPVPAGATA